MDDATDVAIMTVAGHELVDSNWRFCGVPNGLAADVQAAANALKRFPRAAVVVVDLQKDGENPDAQLSAGIDHIALLFRAQGIFVIQARDLPPTLECGHKGCYWASTEDNN